MSNLARVINFIVCTSCVISSLMCLVSGDWKSSVVFSTLAVIVVNTVAGLEK